MTLNNWIGKINPDYEKFKYINQSGKALDDNYNDYLTENGEVVYVSKPDRFKYEMVIT